MNKPVIVVSIFLVALIAIFLWWFISNKNITTEKPIQAQTENSNQPGGLGSEISAKIQNPLGENLPATGNMASVNPLEGAYQNPFQD